MADNEIKQNYGAEQIQVLEGLEAVRKRPGMYIGTTSVRGLHHLVYEIVDNAIDEALAGYCTHIKVTIKEGDIIGLDDKKILAKATTPEDATMKLIAKMKEDFHQVITLYYGEDVKAEDAEALCEKIAEEYPDCDVDFHSGGQPVYYYVISLE